MVAENFPLYILNETSPNLLVVLLIFFYIFISSSKE